MPTLPSTDPSADAPPLDPARVLSELAAGFQSLDSLLKLLNCTPDQLAQTLDHPTTHSLFQLRLKVVTMQVQLAAAKAAPAAASQLIELAETADKPEVKRRALTTVLAVAGISTTPPKPAAPPRPPKDEPPQPNEPPVVTPLTEEEGNRLLNSVNIRDVLQTHHGCDIFDVPGGLHDDYCHAIAAFFDTHNIPRYSDTGHPLNLAANALPKHPKPPE